MFAISTEAKEYIESKGSQINIAMELKYSGG
jgi:hypothetical protein